MTNGRVPVSHRVPTVSPSAGHSSGTVSPGHCVPRVPRVSRTVRVYPFRGVTRPNGRVPGTQWLGTRPSKITERLASDVDELARHGGLIDRLNELLAHGNNPHNGENGKRQKISGSPAPWNAEAADIAMTIHAAARETENEMLYRLCGHTINRGGSDGNTKKALARIAQLIEAMPDHIAEEIKEQVHGWAARAQQHTEIDTAERWEPLPRQPGCLPPACPYCGTYGLRMVRRAGRVRCNNRACRDDNGYRPVARMEYGKLTGNAYLIFTDGKEISS